jgi:hypothetical protein
MTQGDLLDLEVLLDEVLDEVRPPGRVWIALTAVLAAISVVMS